MNSRFGWYELYTTDTAAAHKFYGDLVGWKAQTWEHSPDYTMWVAPGGPVGGVMTLPEAAKAMGAPPHWMGYVSVASVGDAAAIAEKLGGKVVVPPQDLPNGGRFAILQDPTGAHLGVHSSGDSSSSAPRRGLGEFGWAELMSSDPDKAFAFYSELFGWVKTESMDMGPEMGTYQMFGHASADGSGMIGGMMKLPPGMPQSAWLYYATVPDAAEALDKTRAGGGTVLHGPMEVPGGGKVGAILDPQGAAFAILAEP